MCVYTHTITHTHTHTHIYIYIYTEQMSGKEQCRQQTNHVAVICTGQGLGVLASMFVVQAEG